ncbi:hypothetical protein ID866_3517 [Astraeus odoratus]|nr:hypothetical protein ID866_3517 [Astraeus odoratus]
MGKLVWNELSRYISLTSSACTIWASFSGIFFRKFFWDFAGGVLRNPGGIQPSPRVRIFVFLVVKTPLVQIMAMIIASFVLALEWPVPHVQGTALHRSITLRIIMLLQQAFLSSLFYQACSFTLTYVSRVHPCLQGADASLWSLIAAGFYVRALAGGEIIGVPEGKGRGNQTQADTMGPSEIIRSIPDKFQTALSSGDLLFFPSEIRLHCDIGIEFEVRLCPALQAKPAQRQAGGEALVSREPDTNSPGKSNPFAPPYPSNLYVGDLSLEDEDGTAEYVILLNKFSVVPRHFLLVTKVQVYQLLLAARKENKDMIAFYNCGARSGASQPHKHIQFIEVTNGGPPIEKLTCNVNLETPGKPFAITSLPYANHVFRLPKLSTDATVADLRESLFPPFLSLLDLVISTVRHDPEYPLGPPSYNVILTLEHMHLIPRRHETYALDGMDSVISVNSLGYAGLMLAKSESELEGIKKIGPGKILQGVGVQSVHELQVAGTSLEADLQS